MSSGSNSKFLKCDQELIERKIQKTPSPTKKLKKNATNKSESSDCEMIEEYCYIFLKIYYSNSRIIKFLSNFEARKMLIRPSQTKRKVNIWQPRQRTRSIQKSNI